jgi:hypothetical protein
MWHLVAAAVATAVDTVTSAAVVVIDRLLDERSIDLPEERCVIAVWMECGLCQSMNDQMVYIEIYV